jgi:hypothetical protein
MWAIHVRAIVAAADVIVRPAIRIVCALSDRMTGETFLMGNTRPVPYIQGQATENHLQPRGRLTHVFFPPDAPAMT